MHNVGAVIDRPRTTDGRPYKKFFAHGRWYLIKLMTLRAHRTRFYFWWRRGVTIDYQVIEHMENAAISGDVPGMATFVYAFFTRMVLLLIQELILQI